MDIKNIKVSIIIPTYKRSVFLTRAINSALNQTHGNIEVIIVDDNNPGSEYEKETKIALDIYKTDIRVVYHKNKKNLGCALARNEGIKVSTGEYITFLDDDDIYLPEKVESQLRYMIENQFDMSLTALRLHNEDNKLIDYRSFDDIKGFSNNSLLKYHIMRHLTGTDTFMYKRNFILKIGAFDDSDMGDEFYLMYKTICNCAKIGYIDKSYVIAYVHQSEGVSKGAPKITGENQLYDFKKSQFELFTKRERMFIRYRHHIVLAVSYLRARKIFRFLLHTLGAFIMSPFDFIYEPVKLIYKVSKVGSYKADQF
mgnify:CR=1 FL=1|jgi:glycosyltransferase involved in cell wall biosynthesis